MRKCGFRPGLTQTELYKHTRSLEAGNYDLESGGIVVCSKNKGAGQFHDL